MVADRGWKRPRSTIRFRCSEVASLSLSRTPGRYITKLPKAEHKAAEGQGPLGSVDFVARRRPATLVRIRVNVALEIGKPQAARPRPRQGDRRERPSDGPRDDLH